MNVSVLKQRKLLIRLFFDTYEYKHKLIYKSLATLACRNFYSILLPEQRRWQSLFLTVAPKVQAFSDTAGVVAGGGEEYSWNPALLMWKLPKTSGYFCRRSVVWFYIPHTKAQMLAVFRHNDTHRHGTCACKYPISEHNQNDCRNDVGMQHFNTSWQFVFCGVLLQLLLFCFTVVS